jgi:hypothetical protein
VSTNVNLPVILAQLPRVAAIAAEAQSHPESQAAALADAAKQARKREGKRVTKAEKTEFVSALKREEERGGKQAYAQSEKKEEREDAEQHDKKSRKNSANPWAGNILDITI